MRVGTLEFRACGILLSCLHFFFPQVERKKERKMRVVGVLVLCLVLPFVCLGKTIFVCNGAENGDGSYNSPFGNIQVFSSSSPLSQNHFHLYNLSLLFSQLSMLLNQGMKS